MPLPPEPHAPASIGRYLSGVGLAAEPPAIAATRPPPQRESDLVFLSQAIPSFPDRYAIGRALLCLPSRTPSGLIRCPVQIWVLDCLNAHLYVLYGWCLRARITWKRAVEFPILLMTACMVSTGALGSDRTVRPGAIKRERVLQRMIVGIIGLLIVGVACGSTGLIDGYLRLERTWQPGDRISFKSALGI